MLSAQWQSRMLIVQSVDAYRTRGLYVHSYITFVQYWRVCRTLRVCMCVQCSHRQTHGSLRSGEYYRGVDHRRTRPITNRQAPHINPLHSDASPLCLSVSLSFFFFPSSFMGLLCLTPAHSPPIASHTSVLTRSLSYRHIRIGMFLSNEGEKIDIWNQYIIWRFSFRLFGSNNSWFVTTQVICWQDIESLHAGFWLQTAFRPKKRWWL